MLKSRHLRLLAGITLLYAGLMARPTLALEFSPCQQSQGAMRHYGAECATLTVKENPTSSLSADIAVHIMRLPAIRPGNTPPVFFIAGGPGQASTDLISQFRYQFARLLVDRDFIFVDQRGTGKSNPLNCDVNLLAYAELPLNELEKVVQKKYQQCLEGYQSDLSAYTTPYAVADLEQVRSALGYSKVSLWGGSYGSRVVIEYLRQHPQHVSAAVVDGVAPVSIQLPFFSERDGSKALASTLQRCQVDPACNKAFPNLEERWLGLLDRLAKTPQQLTLVHPRTQAKQQIYLDHEVISSWVRTALYSREVVAILPFALHHAIEGDYAKLFSVFAIALEGVTENISEGMQLAVLCAEDQEFNKRHPPDIESYKRLLTLPAPESFAGHCQGYPASRIDGSFFEPLNSEVPTLILSGEFDPVTPSSWGKTLLSQLSQGRHIVVPGGHHIVSNLGCVPKLIQEFITTPTSLSTIDENCIAAIAPPPFFIDGAGPQLENTMTSDKS